MSLRVIQELHTRPHNRADCKGGIRPCPWVSCRYNLYLDVRPNGSIQLNFPDKEPDEMCESCALDVADRGAQTLQVVASLIGTETHQEIDRIERMALRKAKAQLLASDPETDEGQR